MKETRKIMKEQYDELTMRAKKNSGGFAMKGKELLKENPHIVHIDGVYADANKENTSTIMGQKLK